jgi:hypothetical protein
MKYASFFLSLLIIPSAFAIPPGKWQCTAYDAKEHNFTAVGEAMDSAQRAAIAACHAASNQPKTCKSAQSFCEQGPLSLNSAECLVSDDTGRSWSADGSDACRTAMSMCYQFHYLQGGPHGQCTIKHDATS